MQPSKTIAIIMHPIASIMIAKEFNLPSTFGIEYTISIEFFTGSFTYRENLGSRKFYQDIHSQSKSITIRKSIRKK